MAVTKHAVIDLYRRSLREIPRTVAIFDLELTEAEAKKRVRILFDQHRGLTDEYLISKKYYFGEQTLMEVKEHFMQKTHIWALLKIDSKGGNESDVRELPRQGESKFLQEFYQGIQH